MNWTRWVSTLNSKYRVSYYWTKNYDLHLWSDPAVGSFASPTTFIFPLLVMILYELVQGF